jgi:hypothetical protein
LNADFIKTFSSFAISATSNCSVEATPRDLPSLHSSFQILALLSQLIRRKIEVSGGI